MILFIRSSWRFWELRGSESAMRRPYFYPRWFILELSWTDYSKLCVTDIANVSFYDTGGYLKWHSQSLAIWKNNTLVSVTIECWYRNKVKYCHIYSIYMGVQQLASPPWLLCKEKNKSWQVINILYIIIVVYRIIAELLHKKNINFVCFFLISLQFFIFFF